MPLFYSVNFPSLSQAKGQMAELQAQVCPSLSQFVPVCPSLSQAKGQMAELQAQTNGRPTGRIVNLVLGR